MGEMDDFEAASIIQEEHSVPVVFLTCFNDEEPPEGPVKSIDLR